MLNKIFISYSWKNEEIVNDIDSCFKDIFKISLTRDKRDLKYKDNVNDFMKKIREHDKFILCLSDEYFKSFNCMKELSEAIKEPQFKEK